MADREKLRASLKAESERMRRNLSANHRFWLRLSERRVTERATKPGVRRA